MLLKSSNQPTLLSRVRQHSLWLAFTLFLLFSGMTLFIVFALEDAVFKDQLKQTYHIIQQGGSLPANMTLVTQTDTFTLSDSEQLKYFEFDAHFGEFTQGDQHFHFMKTDLGVLLLNSSELGIISRAIDDILVILLLMLLPTLLLTYWFSNKLSEKALRPFSKIHHALAAEHLHINEVKATLSDIEEQDIQLITKKLVDALEQKTHLLQQQIAFNQGMAHEIRTPLQVMSHSMELISASAPELASLKSYHRLDKAIARMHRLSSALLWLTSDAREQHTTQVRHVLDTVLSESQALIALHQIDVRINEPDPPKTLSLPIPEVVLELVILNLLTNVIHHCQTSEADKYWQISISQSQIRFCNPTVQTPNDTSAHDNFGLGLQLVAALMDKFNVGFEAQQNNLVFSISLRVNKPLP
ncbi:sensor histidine kinase [Pseudoalteromonas ardens]|uniref:sensor histidine kinase n=1 Tax=Pseudoalteromonas ardens TaxID=3048490 RepID=UPI0024C37864|nr:hypothetical protein [Pseudoalteromonas sp. R96]MDK1312126.1 hypothetical protein [Pseudoalteromonas sp. R96]